MSGDGVVIFLIAICIIAVLLFVVILLTRKSPAALNVAYYRSQWLKVEQVLTRDEKASHQLAVLQADKLLDQAMRHRGISGQTMGERMKNAQNKWSNADAIWGAHKIRNRIAHEPEFQPSFDEARRALGAFKQALKDLGAI